MKFSTIFSMTALIGSITCFPAYDNPISKIKCDGEHTIYDEEATILKQGIQDDQKFGGKPQHFCFGRACVSWSRPDVEIPGDWLKAFIWQMQNTCNSDNQKRSSKMDMIVGGKRFYLCLSDRAKGCK